MESTGEHQRRYTGAGLTLALGAHGHGLLTLSPTQKFHGKKAGSQVPEARRARPAHGAAAWRGVALGSQPQKQLEVAFLGTPGIAAWGGKDAAVQQEWRMSSSVLGETAAHRRSAA
jgi:hypothetical protein